MQSKSVRKAKLGACLFNPLGKEREVRGQQLVQDLSSLLGGGEQLGRAEGRSPWGDPSQRGEHEAPSQQPMWALFSSSRTGGREGWGWRKHGPAPNSLLPVQQPLHPALLQHCCPRWTVTALSWQWAPSDSPAPSPLTTPLASPAP